MIPNLLLEALIMAKLSEVQKSICYYIYRRTYGWNCVYDAISIGDMAEACNANRSHVTRQVNDLIKKILSAKNHNNPAKLRKGGMGEAWGEAWGRFFCLQKRVVLRYNDNIRRWLL